MKAAEAGPASGGVLCKKEETEQHRYGFGVGFDEFRLTEGIWFVNGYFWN